MLVLTYGLMKYDWESLMYIKMVYAMRYKNVSLKAAVN